jgi:site-specific DNA-methyltransferase (cytosine-N4-specific)
MINVSVKCNEEGRSILERLNDIDWSFKERIPAPLVESIHPYPAKFIGDIPRTLIDILPIPSGTSVFDPFCGSGTTLMEAQRAGLPSVGIDLNPIACLISRVKTSLLPDGFDDAVLEVVAKARKIKSLPASNIPNVNHWFTPEIQLPIGALMQVISEPTYSLWSDQLRLILSSILVRVSNQESDTRYAAVEKNVTSEDVLNSFCGAAIKLKRALLARNWNLSTTAVVEGNTLEILPAEIRDDIGLVVTSPPYPNAYEYWLYHKYRMWWLGFDPISVKENEIGARAHFFKKNHHTAEHFICQMERTFKLINGVLVKDGFVCFIIGRSKIHGKIVDNGEIITQAATKMGLCPVTSIERSINAHRKSFNLSHANIKTESVLVFQKE